MSKTMRFKGNKLKYEDPNGHSLGGDDTKRCVLNSDGPFSASGSCSQLQPLPALILGCHLQSLTEKTSRSDFIGGGSNLVLSEYLF